jgi:excisionase family DNA binding protein
MTAKQTAIESDYCRGQSEAARYCRVSPRTISAWQTRGLIAFLKPSRKIVLFRKRDLDAALDRFTVEAVGVSR